MRSSHTRSIFTSSTASQARSSRPQLISELRNQEQKRFWWLKSNKPELSVVSVFSVRQGSAYFPTAVLLSHDWFMLSPTKFLLFRRQKLCVLSAHQTVLSTQWHQCTQCPRADSSSWRDTNYVVRLWDREKPKHPQLIEVKHVKCQRTWYEKTQQNKPDQKKKRRTKRQDKVIPYTRQVVAWYAVMQHARWSCGKHGFKRSGHLSCKTQVTEGVQLEFSEASSFSSMLTAPTVAPEGQPANGT